MDRHDPSDRVQPSITMIDGRSSIAPPLHPHSHHCKYHPFRLHVTIRGRSTRRSMGCTRSINRYTHARLPTMDPILARDDLLLVQPRVAWHPATPRPSWLQPTSIHAAAMGDRHVITPAGDVISGVSPRPGPPRDSGCPDVQGTPRTPGAR